MIDFTKICPYFLETALLSIEIGSSFFISPWNFSLLNVPPWFEVFDCRLVCWPPAMLSCLNISELTSLATPSLNRFALTFSSSNFWVDAKFYVLLLQTNWCFSVLLPRAEWSNSLLVTFMTFSTWISKLSSLPNFYLDEIFGMAVTGDYLFYSSAIIICSCFCFRLASLFTFKLLFLECTMTRPCRRSVVVRPCIESGL